MRYVYLYRGNGKCTYFHAFRTNLNLFVQTYVYLRVSRWESHWFMNICVCVYVRTGVPLYVHIYVYAYWCMVMNVIRLLVRECVCTSLLKVFVQFALLTFRSSPASLFNISLMHSCNAQLIKGNFSPPPTNSHHHHHHSAAAEGVRRQGLPNDELLQFALVKLSFSSNPRDLNASHHTQTLLLNKTANSSSWW